MADKKQPKRVIAAAMLLLVPHMARADSDAQADLTVNLMLTSDRSAIQRIEYGWTFDSDFSVQMTESWDDNDDKALNAAELRNASNSVLKATQPYHYYLLLQANGQDMPFNQPAQRAASMADGRLTVSFAATLANPLPLHGTIEIGLFDPTFSLELDPEGRMTAPNLPAHCSSKIVEPDFDQVLAQNPDALGDPDGTDPDGSKTIKLFATRLVLTC